MELDKDCPSPCSRDTQKVRLLLEMANETKTVNIDSALSLALSASELAGNIADRKKTGPIGIADYLIMAHETTGSLYEASGQTNKALEYYAKALDMSRKAGKDKKTADLLNSIGLIYDIYIGELDSAFMYYREALDLSEKTGYSPGVINSLVNIGFVYELKGDLSRALTSFNESAEAAEGSGNLKSLANCLNHMGRIHYKQGEMNKALQTYRQSIEVSEEVGHMEEIASSYNNIGGIYMIRGDIDSALIYYHKSLEIKKEMDDKEGMAATISNLGSIYYNRGDILKALEYYEESLDLKEEVGDVNGVATSYNNLGLIYDDQGDLVRALENYHKALEIYENRGDKQAVAISYNNIGYVYEKQGDLKNALEYYQKSLENLREAGNKKGAATTMMNIGSVYEKQGQSGNSLEFYRESLSIYEEIGDTEGMAISYNNIGSNLKKQKKYAEALEYLNRSLDLHEQSGNRRRMVSTLINLAALYRQQGNNTLFKRYAQRAYQISKELGFPQEINSAAALMKDVYLLQGDYRSAYNLYTEEMMMRDSILNEENFKQTQKLQARYEYLKQKAVDSVAHVKAMQMKELELQQANQEKEKQRIIIYGVLAGLFIIIAFSVFLLRLFIQKRRANLLLEARNEEISHQKDEIEAQRDEIEAQRDLVVLQKEQIEQIHRELSQSIDYARRLQAAILPDEQLIKDVFAGYFIMFRPRDKVSGDFYWWTRVGDEVIVVVADCTGHGVPGSLMSMLGISLLREIVLKEGITNPASILDHLRMEVIKILDQSGTGTKQKDGMDMSILTINTNTGSCQWSGANNSLLIVSTDNDTRKEIREIKADKMPIAIYDRMNAFSLHDLKLQKGDRLYLYSDGFPDQFGGAKGKKFKYKPFRELLFHSDGISIESQGQELNRVFDEWIRYDGQVYPQIDDVTVLGLEMGGMEDRP